MREDVFEFPLLERLVYGKPAAQALAAEVAKLVAMPETREKLDAQGFVPYYNNPEQTAALLKADIANYARIIKAANIKGE